MATIIENLQTIKDQKTQISGVIDKMGFEVPKFTLYSTVLNEAAEDREQLCTLVTLSCEDLKLSCEDLNVRALSTEQSLISDKFLETTVTDGVFLQSTGTILPSEDWKGKYRVNSVEVFPGQTYKITTYVDNASGGMIRFNDANNQQLSVLTRAQYGEDAMTDYEIVAPENCKKFIIGCGGQSIKHGTLVKTPVFTLNELNSLKNVLPSTRVNGLYLQNTGSYQSYSGYRIDYVSVTPGKKYGITTTMTNSNGAMYMFCEPRADKPYDGSRVLIKKQSDYTAETGKNYMDNYIVTAPDRAATLVVACGDPHTKYKTQITEIITQNEKFDVIDNEITALSTAISSLNESNDYEHQCESDRLYALERKLGFKWKTPFDKGKIVFMTDDAETDLGVVCHILSAKYDYHMSFAIPSDRLSRTLLSSLTELSNTVLSDYNKSDFTKMQDLLVAELNYGGEIWSHSIGTAVWTSTTTLEESEQRLRDSKKTLESAGLKCTGFVSPSHVKLDTIGEEAGVGDGFVRQMAKYYRYARNSTKYIDPYKIPVTNMDDFDVETLKQKILNCIVNKDLLIIYKHTVFNAESWTAEKFVELFDFIKQKTDARELEWTNVRTVFNQYATIQ